MSRRRRGCYRILTSSTTGTLPGRLATSSRKRSSSRTEKNRRTPGAKWVGTEPPRPRLLMHQLGALRGSTEFPHLGHTRRAIAYQPGTVLRHRVADTSHVHGRGVLAQRPELRSDPLLRHRTVLPTARRRWAPVWPRRAAARRDRMVDAVRGSRDRQRRVHLRARVDFRAVPIFVKAVLRTSGRRRPVRW